MGVGKRGGGAERGVEGAGSGAAWSDGRRVAVVTTGVGRVTSLCRLRRRAGWGEEEEEEERREDSPSLSGVLRASMISSWALDTECCVPYTQRERETAS